MEPTEPQQPTATGQLQNQQQAAAPQRKNESGLAIASVICGGLSFFFWLLTAIPAVICGHMALTEIKKAPDSYDSSSRTMALVGLILGYIFIGFSVLSLLFFIGIMGMIAANG